MSAGKAEKHLEQSGYEIAIFPLCSVYICL